MISGTQPDPVEPTEDNGSDTEDSADRWDPGLYSVKNGVWSIFRIDPDYWWVYSDRFRRAVHSNIGGSYG